MIVGLHGKMRAGKDTTYAYIRKVHPDAVRIGFADKLKQSAAACLGVSVEAMEAYKLEEDMFYYPLIQRQQDDEEFMELRTRLTPFNIRGFLQRFGTEGHRQIFGDNFWIDAALPKHDEGCLYVVTDVRFENEAQAIRDRNGIIIEIIRPSDAEGDVHHHASEQQIDNELVDMMVMNDRTLGDLCATVKDEVWPYIHSEWKKRESRRHAHSV